MSGLAGEPGVYQTKKQSVVETLRHWILIGRLEPGQRLDQEWLAATLNVSRMPLRQALVQLSADGLIINRPHSSSIVTPLSVALLEDVYASRKALEAMLAEAGARRVDQDTLQAMEKIIEKQETVVENGDTESYVRLDRLFHALLYRASGYEQSCALIERLRDTSDRYVRFYAQDRHGAHKSILEHWKILRALEKQQPLQVKQIIEQHIGDGYAALMSIVREHERRTAADLNVHEPAKDPES
ncbi:GntR family transcriptional regulator [Pigmentiphaga soli]|uniref:GntR family transcriptional regulator n=1 Tax=Pigmentiphaga soli TaxID=1007095 RepID=A0ABP8GFB9_9BURK